MVFALVCVLTPAYGRLFRTIWFYSVGYGIKIHNFMFLLLLIQTAPKFCPDMTEQKSFQLANL